MERRDATRPHEPACPQPLPCADQLGIARPGGELVLPQIEKTLGDGRKLLRRAGVA